MSCLLQDGSGLARARAGSLSQFSLAHSVASNNLRPKTRHVKKGHEYCLLENPKEKK